MRTKRWVAAILTATIAFGATGVLPASAAPPFQTLFTQYPITVNGSYVPLAGETLDCGDGRFGIVWYAPGPAKDYLWTDFAEDAEGNLDYTSELISVGGTYEPFVGDFDGDHCDDIFWYAPGAAADYVWFANADGTFTSTRVSVSGHYLPVVTDFNGTVNDDIFWYADGGGTESIWQGNDLRTFTPSAGPQVGGNGYQVAPLQGARIAFYRPGAGADYLWVDVAAGASAPGSSVRLDPIGASYQMHSLSSALMMYAPGSERDLLLGGFQPDGSYDSLPGSILGTYRVSAVGGASAPVIVFHAPGTAPDSLWTL